MENTEYLNNIINNVDLIDMLPSFLPGNRKYILSSSAYGTFTKNDYILSYKESLNKSLRSKQNIDNIS